MLTYLIIAGALFAAGCWAGKNTEWGGTVGTLVAGLFAGTLSVWEFGREILGLLF